MNVTSWVYLYQLVMALRALIGHPYVGPLPPPPCLWAQKLHLNSSQGFSSCVSDVRGLPVTVMPLCGHGNCLLIQTLTHRWSSCLGSDRCYYYEAACQSLLCLTLVTITGSDPGLQIDFPAAHWPSFITASLSGDQDSGLTLLPSLSFLPCLGAVG